MKEAKSPSPIYTDLVPGLREASLTQYKIIIQSFSDFLNTIEDKYESAIFEAAGYKWRLILYPNGNLRRHVKGHISLYLAIAETETLPVGWELDVTFKMFVYDHDRDIFLTLFQDEGWLHGMKIECGIDKFLPLNIFNDPSKGYLVDDTCIFGVEVLFTKLLGGKGECVSIVKDPPNGTFTWTINKFDSRCVEQLIYSEPFTLNSTEHKWYLLVCPKGETGSATSDIKYLAVYLVLDDLFDDFPPGSRLYVEGTLIIKSQSNADHHISKQIKHWFENGRDYWGYHEFISLKDLNDESKGYIVNDSIVVECKVTAISVMKYSI